MTSYIPRSSSFVQLCTRDAASRDRERYCSDAFEKFFTAKSWYIFQESFFEESAAVSICNHDAYGRYNGSPTITDIQERTSIDEYALSAKVKPLSKRSLKIFRCAVSRR